MIRDETEGREGKRRRQKGRFAKAVFRVTHMVTKHRPRQGSREVSEEGEGGRGLRHSLQRGLQPASIIPSPRGKMGSTIPRSPHTHTKSQK